jgi:hypothetical protein
MRLDVLGERVTHWLNNAPSKSITREELFYGDAAIAGPDYAENARRVKRARLA